MPAHPCAVCGGETGPDSGYAVGTDADRHYVHQACLHVLLRLCVGLRPPAFPVGTVGWVAGDWVWRSHE